MSRSSNVDVVLRLRGGKSFQTQVAAATKSLQTMGVRGAGALGAFARKADSLKQAGSTMTRNLTLPAVALGAVAGKTALDFDRSMAQVQVALDAPAEGMASLRDLSMKMGAETIFSANDASQAMLELAKGGLTAAEIQGGALQTTMSLAAAGGLDLASAAKQSSAAMNTFGMAAKDSGTIADALAGAANASSADVSDLSLSLSQAGQGAVMAGLNIHETAGALAAFADNGIRGSDAGTSLKTMLSRLAPSTAKAKDKMNELGISFFDAEGKTKSLRGIARELETGLGDLSEKERSLAMTTMFGSDAKRAANILTNEGVAGIDKYIRATKEEGAAQKMANAQMQGLAGAWERLKGSMETAALALGVALTPTLEGLAGGLEKIANIFTALPSGVQKFAAGIVLAAAVIGPLTSALGYLAQGLGKYLQFLVWVKSGQMKAAVTTGILRVRLWALSVAEAAAAAKSKVLAAATWLLNVAMRANPIMLVVTALAAIAAALVTAYHKNEAFRNIVDDVANFLRTKMEPAIRWVINAVKDLVGWIIDAIEKFEELKGKLPGGLGSGGSMTNPDADTFLPESSVGGWLEGKLRGQAAGTRDWPGGATWVGEEGPEIVRLPRGSDVFSHPESMAMAAGGGALQLTGDVNLDGRKVGDALFRAQRNRDARR